MLEKLQIAEDKVAKLGVRLSWNWGKSFYLLDGMFPTFPITEKDEYRFILSSKDEEKGICKDNHAMTQGRWVVRRGLRTGGGPEECTLLALEAFHFAAEDGVERNGKTDGRDISGRRLGQFVSKSGWTYRFVL